MSDAGTTDRLVVALVRSAHGLRGELRIEVLTDRPDERFAPGAVLHREGSEASLTVVEARPVADGPGWWLRLREVADRTAADALRGAYLEAEVDREPGTVYWHEVVGAPVRDTDGRELGTVRDVYRAGETEVYVVSGGSAGEFDVPAVRAFVRVLAPGRDGIVVDAAALGLGEADEPVDPGR